MDTLSLDVWSEGAAYQGSERACSAHCSVKAVEDGQDLHRVQVSRPGHFPPTEPGPQEGHESELQGAWIEVRADGVV